MQKPSIYDSEVFRFTGHRPYHNEADGGDYMLSNYPYLDVVLTDICNSRCRFCIADLLHKRIVNCDTHVFKDQIAFAVRELGVQEVLLLGGEPTMSLHLFEMIEFCRTLNLQKICITTNGKRLGQDLDYAYKLMSSGITHMNVSIMSFDKEAQNFVHGTKNNLDFDGFLAISAMADACGVHLRVNTNVYKGNHDSVQGMADFFNSVRSHCDSVKFSPLLRTDAFSVVPKVNEFNRDFILPPEQYEALFDGMVDRLHDHPLVTNARTFGFVEYKMILLATPILLNYNHRGQMLQRAVEHQEINNIKLLPNGNLSRSWNREELGHVIRFGTAVI